MRLDTALRSAAAALAAAGCELPQLDAQVLLAHLLGVERAWLFAHGEQLLTPGQAARYAALIRRRSAAEPVAYLTGSRAFYGLQLAVDRRVLIPRPETELLVEVALARVAARSAAILADVGTGSGAIALAVAAHAPHVRIYASDASSAALAVAAVNVARLDQRRQIILLEGEFLAPLPEPVDLIAANLPYVARADYGTLAPDVRLYEPREALVAGDDGLDAIRGLLAQAPAALLPGGCLLLEIGHGQGRAALGLVPVYLPGAVARLQLDFSGHERLLVVTIP